MKKLKKSTRGLTFALDESVSEIGSKYRYIVDKKKGEVIIIPDANGTMTVSRKKSGKHFKPLYDIRSREVKTLLEKADYLEVEVLKEKIVVHVYRKDRQKLQKSKIISIEEFLGRKTGEIVLKKASGSCDYEQLDLFTYYSGTNGTEETHFPLCREELQQVYSVVSLFSGAGLLDYAFKDPHFRIVYGIDFDEDACATYRENIGEHIVCRDIRNVTAEEVPSSDVVIGGPCCQGYSNANRRNIDAELSIEKRLLIDDYVRLVKKKQPNVFVIENVPQFLTKENGLYLSRVTENLTDYDITWTTIEDSEVGGYTTRKRAIIIGSKIGSITLPTKTIHSIRSVKEALSKVDVSWYNYQDITKSSAQTKKLLSYVKPGGNWKDIPESVHRFHPSTHSDRYRRLAWDELSPTIVNWRKVILAPPVGNRILSVSEAAALMGLDKNFKVLGHSLNSKQQQIGNGVTQAIGKLIKDTVLQALQMFSKKQLVTT